MQPIYIIKFVDYGNIITTATISRFNRYKNDHHINAMVDSYRKKVQDGEVLKIHAYDMYNSDAKRHIFMARLSPKQLRETRLFFAVHVIRTWDETMEFFDSLLTGDYIKSEGIDMLKTDVRGELFDE